ncbi:retrovirus-related pol polyprotein from transposon TNT 1-94 [Tanacetum coccineum]|uniref:Retrovirus-related pol polyprotein from transposon TNT 1-94 n=1 Tax=Tanacetum coccineum TaxID=301880 RepID=A0ABQ5GNM4_9ASTR
MSFIIAIMEAGSKDRPPMLAPVYHPPNHPTQNTQYSSTRTQQSTRNRGKAIVTSSAPTYDPEPATVTEDEEMSKEKEIDKLMALISLSFKKIYKPTNNNLRTSSNTSRANQDNSPRTNRGNWYDNQRELMFAGAREKCRYPVVQKSGIQCYNCKEYGHVSRECQKPKRVKDAAYHKEKMLLCKQEEAGVQLNAEQADWKDDTDDESEEQELEAHYMYMAQLQEVTPDSVDTSGPIFDDEPMHKVQNNNDNYNVFAMENEHPEQPELVIEYISANKVTPISLLIHRTLRSSKRELDKYKDVNYASKCVLNDNHDLCVLHYINGVNSRTRQPMAVPVSTTEPKHNVNQSVATSIRHGQVGWYPKYTPSGYKWKLSLKKEMLNQNVSMPSREKHLELLYFVKIRTPRKFLGTGQVGTDQIAPILGYGDLVQGNDYFKRVYYVEGLNHNLFSVGQFCDADLEVAFRKSTCYIRDLKGNDLLTEGIRHETSTARTPEQNGVVERRNRTLVEAARTMLSAAKVPLFFWAEAIATTCFTQNRSLVIPRHEKTPYHIINARKPSVKFFHIFGSLCYIVRDGENLDKMKEKGDACIFVGYSTQSKAYRVFNKRTRMIVETIHVNFDELPQMASDHVSSDPGPQCSTTVLEQDSLSPGPQSQENVPQVAETVTTSNELELLYSPMFSELLNGNSHVV